MEVQVGRRVENAQSCTANEGGNVRKLMATLFIGAAVAASLAGSALAGKSPSPDGNCGVNQVTFTNGTSDGGSGWNSQDCTAGTRSGGGKPA
jgi:hypothetical protein